jgi:hypothetical protein
MRSVRSSSKSLNGGLLWSKGWLVFCGLNSTALVDTFACDVKQSCLVTVYKIVFRAVLATKPFTFPTEQITPADYG